MEHAAAEPMLHEHLREIRTRLLWSVGVFAVGASVGYVFRSQLIAWLQHPLNQRLYYTSPTGSFEFIMKLCMLVGLLVALPVFLYHALRFIEPAFTRRFTKKLMAAMILCSLSLAVAGVAFAYYISLPAALRFFASISPHQLTALINVNQYFSFVFAYLATFAVVFQLPLILLFIDHVTPINPGGLGRWRKFVVVGAFAIALIIPSAPDPLSQVILALPIIILYEVSLVLVRLRHRRLRRKTPPQPAAVVVPTVAPVAEPPARPEPLAIPASYRVQPGATLDLRAPIVHAAAASGALDLRTLHKS